MPAPAVGNTLSLADAIAIAKRSNPQFQSALNQRRSADITARSANGTFLPRVSSSLGGGYRAGGQSIVNGITQGASSGTLSSSGSISAGLDLSAAQFSDRKANLTEREIANADIAGSEQTLRVGIINQYIAVLQAQANAALQDTLLVSTAAQLELAKAKLQVGTGIQLEVQQAEVNNGRQRVDALNAHNNVDIQKIRLFQQMGVEPVMGMQLQELRSMEMPAENLEQILTGAKTSNPTLLTNRAREKQSGYRLTSARRQYLPSFSIGTSVGGQALRFTDSQFLIDQARSGAPFAVANCQRSEEVRLKLGLDNNFATCEARNAFTAEDEAAIRSSQDGFPFGFNRNPLGFNLSLSLPIFNGFQREAGIQNAAIARRNAQNTVRQQELQLNADITIAWMTLTTSRQTVAQNELNVTTARLALSLAQQRYQLGLISLVDLITQQSAFNQAESARIAAVYEFQRQFAALEAAVGRPLR
ncbi:MAG: TolC family protein [Phycisphaerae bacterium]|nr:TolC family protein [Gemmatimonadaceae bacterium]